jgi:hypothetical protein
MPPKKKQPPENNTTVSRSRRKSAKSKAQQSINQTVSQNAKKKWYVPVSFFSRISDFVVKI